MCAYRKHERCAQHDVRVSNVALTYVCIYVSMHVYTESLNDACSTVILSYIAPPAAVCTVYVGMYT
jgi:hypothetical protein